MPRNEPSDAELIALGRALWAALQRGSVEVTIQAANDGRDVDGKTITYVVTVRRRPDA
jgi:hypothetical protein